MDAYIDVILPPSKANCTVELSESHPKFHEVHCTAILGSEKSGNLVCFQNSEKALLKCEIFRTASFIRASFWMRVDFPINCCSVVSSNDADPNSCDDFVLQPNGTPNNANFKTVEPVVVTEDNSGNMMTTEGLHGETTLMNCSCINYALESVPIISMYKAFDIATSMLIYLVILMSIYCVVTVVLFCKLCSKSS